MRITESAADFYDEALQAINESATEKAYNHLHQIFIRCINQQTSFTDIDLVGPFAKTDFLLKENEASYDIVQSTNNLRVRLRNFKAGTILAQKLEKFLPHDFKALCLFISTIFHSPIPAACSRLFPKGALVDGGKRKLLSKTDEYKRIIVESLDDEFFYGTLDSESADKVTVCYAHGNKLYDYGWTYLRKQLRQGTQVNIIRPRIENDIIYPELIIVEPDYLVDISAIAACFEEYATSPIIHLLNKIMPNESTEPILLGNFAGQLLDEEIRGDKHSYSESATSFYKSNSLNLLTAGISPKFHAEAQKQKANIHNAISVELPKAIEKYDSNMVMVEPTFFSEMLGIQGRMDFFQLDHRVIIEQKSGKCGFPQQNPDTPVIQTKHYVQILLYMALLRYNYREQYERNGRQLHAFLLYSKYKNSMLGVGFAPELLFEALRVRNGIACSEIYYSNGGINLLTQITAERININQTGSKLWQNYQRPKIEELLAPIKTASPTEQAYYIRFLTFIEKEHLLSKLGSRTKENSGFASAWLDTFDDKLLAGNICASLTLQTPETENDGKIETITVRFNAPEDIFISNFRCNDIVILYPYKEGTTPDARTTMVFRCTIEEIKHDSMILRLRAGQSSAYVFTQNKDSKWAIEHDFFESSYKSLYRGMQTFLSAPQERKDLLLLKREPQVDTTKELTDDYESFNKLALRVKQAQDFFLIIGPPGTGKTSYGLVYTLKEELLQPESSILLLSYTNRAVDEICSKLVKEKIDFIRIGGRTSCAKEYRPYLLENKAENCPNVNAMKEMIAQTRVFAGTTSAFNSHSSLFTIKQFTLSIIDEASQILEPHLIGLLCAQNNGKPAIRKFVMIGDHKQLPAVVQQSAETSKVTDPLLNDIMLTDCRLSLFERLLRKYGDNPAVTYMLTRQGRMHHYIAEFPNQAFYNGNLTEVPLKHQLRPLPSPASNVSSIDGIISTHRLSFINVPAPENSLSDKTNLPEATVIANAVVAIYNKHKSDFNALTTVGVIVPYRNQIATIHSIIEQYNIPQLQDITIDTVERYQGSQRDYIIYGFTIQKPYQLNFLTDNTFDEDGKTIDRKLNVAMTRAREVLLITGNAPLLCKDKVFRSLIDFIRQKKAYYDSYNLK